MNGEAYTVSYDRANYRAPVKGDFDSFDILKRREEGIKDNILRYLGEYRLGVKFDEFFYRVETDSSTSEKYLAGKEPGPIRDIFRRAIRAKEEKGLPVRREVAECLGFQKLEKELLGGLDDKLFVWVSPPGSEEEGYGLYSFTFIGEAIKDPETGERKIRVIPYRNVATLEAHRRRVALFSNDCGRFEKDTDFLANPVIFSSNESIKTTDDILSVLGERERFNIEWFERLKQRVGGLMDEYVRLVKTGASDWELVRARNAIENYTISIKNEIIEGKVFSDEELSKKYIFAEFGKDTPPPVAGSCGSTLMELHNEHNRNWEYHLGDCVVCQAKFVDVGPCNICKNCEKEFDKEESMPWGPRGRIELAILASK